MMMQQNRKGLQSKQQGATLATTLVFLMLMTIVSVSATKISILDVLVAGNDQQQMMMFQSTANDLKKLTTVIELYEPLIEQTFDETTGAFQLDDSSAGLTEVITDASKGDIEKSYECGGFDGLAISVGPNEARCYLYDFEVRATKANTGVRDTHNRGGGKEKPNPRKNSIL